LIGQGIFHGDQKVEISMKNPETVSNYEIFQHKILKSQSFKKRAVYWYFYATLNIFSYTGDNLEIKVVISMKNPLSYQIIDIKPLIAENGPKILKKIPKT
jgi:hypothetical protein